MENLDNDLNKEIELACNYIINRFKNLIKLNKGTKSIPGFKAEKISIALRNELKNQTTIPEELRKRLEELFARPSWLNDYLTLEKGNNYKGVYEFLRRSLKKSNLHPSIISPGGEKKGAEYKNAMSLKKDSNEIIALGKNSVRMDEAKIDNYKTRDISILNGEIYARKISLNEVGVYNFSDGYGNQDSYYICKYILKVDDEEYELYGRLLKAYLDFPGAYDEIVEKVISFTDDELEKTNHYIGELNVKRDDKGRQVAYMDYSRIDFFAAKAAMQYDKEHKKEIEEEIITECKFFDDDGSR